MTPTLLTHAEKETIVAACCHTVADAAKKLGISESAVRRQAKRLGVKRISGRVVAGFVAWPNAAGVYRDVTVVMPYAQ